MDLSNLTSADNTTISFALLIIIILFLLIWLVRLELRLRKFMSGGNGSSLESFIKKLSGQVTQTDRINEEIKKHLLSMESRLQRSIQHVKTVRFNPFRDQGQGGNHSFATAFLDQHGNGAVLSTLFSRDKVGVYAKSIQNYKSEVELTEEEKAALAPGAANK